MARSPDLPTPSDLDKMNGEARMKSQWNVRPARPADAARIAEIFNQGIQDAEGTLETRPRSSSEFLALMCRPGYHLFVAEWGGTILGWSSITPYSEGEAYAGVGEASVYISRSSRHQGIGRLLMEALIQNGEQRSYHKLIGRIPVINQPSRRLCRSLGFREVGVHLKHGRVGGNWVDVALVERSLQ